MNNLENYQGLSIAELMETNGGKADPPSCICEVVSDALHVLGQVGLGVLGALAGISDGLTDGMND